MLPLMLLSLLFKVLSAGLLEMHHNLRLDSKIINSRLEHNWPGNEKLKELNEKLNETIHNTEKAITAVQSSLSGLTQAEKAFDNNSEMLTEETNWIKMVESLLELNEDEFDDFEKFESHYNQLMVSINGPVFITVVFVFLFYFIGTYAYYLREVWVYGLSAEGPLNSTRLI